MMWQTLLTTENSFFLAEIEFCRELLMDDLGGEDAGAWTSFVGRRSRGYAALEIKIKRENETLSPEVCP